MISNADCVAGLHEFISLVSWVLYSLKGDLASFLAQSRNLTSSTIGARYALHSRNNMPEAVEKLRNSSANAKRLILASSYNESIKIKWLKCLALYQTALKGLSKHEIHSQPIEYINTAENFLTVLNKLQKLTESLSMNVELITVDQDPNKGMRHLEKLEEAFSETLALTQRYDLTTRLSRKQKKELREELIDLTQTSSS